ncbi:MAG: hypothetical protein U9N04_00505 [Patescibacteria group bacterium]|nr:hypothetical protein [Patescibacteria group bacterium]
MDSASSCQAIGVKTKTITGRLHKVCKKIVLYYNKKKHCAFFLLRNSTEFFSSLENSLLFLTTMKKRNNISVLEKLEASKLRGDEKLRGKTITLVLVGLLLAVCVATPVVSAYTVAGNSNTKVVRIHFDSSEAAILAAWPGYPADVVISEAQRKGISVQRSKRSIKTEIRAHAMLVLGPNIKVPRNGQWRWTHEIANPMDIEMNKEEMWVYLLD